MDELCVLHKGTHVCIVTYSYLLRLKGSDVFQSRMNCWTELGGSLLSTWSALLPPELPAGKRFSATARARCLDLKRNSQNHNCIISNNDGTILIIVIDIICCFVHDITPFYW